MHNYKSYEDYVNYQLIKTSNKDKQKIWMGKEWRMKIDIFKRLFNNNLNLIKNCENALCLGSRTGQEVVALNEIGIKSVIGINLHEFLPYTIKGDIHDLKYDDNTFDLEFTNILDHSIMPEKFLSEIHRTLKPNGILILHIQLGIDQDLFTETVIEKEESLIELLELNFKILIKNNIDSGRIGMNREYILHKK